MARAKKHLVPVIEERLKVEEEYGKDWEGRPVCGSYLGCAPIHSRLTDYWFTL
jgi:hypothetical protein